MHHTMQGELALQMGAWSSVTDQRSCCQEPY